jgi:anti-sigma28 factor (negative regulator of flagellin synthesis)
MDRISPLQPGGVPGLTAPITTPAEQTSASVPQTPGQENVQPAAVTVDPLGSQGTGNVAPQAASPEQIAQLSTAVASGQYQPDPKAIAAAIIAAFTGGES